jgi:hypothetical protein
MSDRCYDTQPHPAHTTDGTHCPGVPMPRPVPTFADRIRLNPAAAADPRPATMLRRVGFDAAADPGEAAYQALTAELRRVRGKLGEAHADCARYAAERDYARRLATLNAESQQATAQILADTRAERDRLAVLLDQTRAGLRVALHHADDTIGYAVGTRSRTERARELDGCRIALQQATEAVEGNAVTEPNASVPSRRAQDDPPACPAPSASANCPRCGVWPVFDPALAAGCVRPGRNDGGCPDCGACPDCIRWCADAQQDDGRPVVTVELPVPKLATGGIVRSSGITLVQSGAEGCAIVSSVIASSSRFARAAGHPSGPDWVRLRTGSGRMYEGNRSPACPGDGQPGHRHDIRCVLRDPAGGVA